MSILKGKPDAGQGGKLGHSNQDHWEYTEEIKLAAKKRRRHEAKKQSADGRNEYLDEKNSTNDQSNLTSDI